MSCGFIYYLYITDSSNTNSFAWKKGFFLSHWKASSGLREDVVVCSYTTEVLGVASDLLCHVNFEVVTGSWLRTPGHYWELHAKCEEDNVSTKCWIVYPYKYRLLVCSSKAFILPAHCIEVVKSGGVASGGVVAM